MDPDSFRFRSRGQRLRFKLGSRLQLFGFCEVCLSEVGLTCGRVSEIVGNGTQVGQEIPENGISSEPLVSFSGFFSYFH